MPLRVVEVSPTAAPPLPDSVEWHPQTRQWWAMWASSPLAESFTPEDWSYLLDTALLHSKFWDGDASVESGLRLRVAKFGQTPEDRARLRIQFATADDTESRSAANAERRAGSSGARARRGPLTSAG